MFRPIMRQLNSPAFGFVLNMGAIVSAFTLYFFMIFILNRSSPCVGHFASIRILVKCWVPFLSPMKFQILLK